MCVPAIQVGPSGAAEDLPASRSTGDIGSSQARNSFRSFWNCRKKIRSRCMPKVSHCSPKTSFCLTERRKHVTTGRQNYTRGDFAGHPEDKGTFTGSCRYDVKIPTPVIATSVWITLGRFVHFCRTKWWQVFNVRSHHFSTYLMHLFRDGLLSSTTISHRASVASVLRHWKYDSAEDPHIKLLIRAFRRERPVQRRIMPKWDLHLVLSALISPPFTLEVNNRGRISDDVIDLRWRTMKTVFLLALASVRWRSYLHALSVISGRCVFGRGNTQRQKMVSLLLEAGFLAKNQLPRLICEQTETKRTGSQRMKSGRCLLHEPTTVRWLYLTFCQLRIGGRQESSRIPICTIWPALLMGCQHWVL